MTEFNKSVKFMLKWSKNLHNSKIIRTFALSIRDKSRSEILKYSLHYIQKKNVKKCLKLTSFNEKIQPKICIYQKKCLPLQHQNKTKK